MFVRDVEEGRRKKERKMWVTRRKRRRREKKGKCASVIEVVKSRLVDRIYIFIFFSSLFSLFLSSFCQLIDFRMTINIKNKVNWLKTKIQTNELFNKR
jgi:hypothetical protein